MDSVVSGPPLGEVASSSVRFESDNALIYCEGSCFRMNGYSEEAREVMACICAGARESAIMRLDESLSVMVAMDAVRRQ